MKTPVVKGGGSTPNWGGRGQVTILLGDSIQADSLETCVVLTATGAFNNEDIGYTSPSRKPIAPFRDGNMYQHNIHSGGTVTMSFRIVEKDGSTLSPMTSQAGGKSDAQGSVVNATAYVADGAEAIPTAVATGYSEATPIPSAPPVSKENPF